MLPLDQTHVSTLSHVAALYSVAEVPELARKAEGLVHQRPKDAYSKAFLAFTQATLCHRAGSTKTALRHFTDMHGFETKQHPWKAKSGWARYGELSEVLLLSTP